MLLARVGLSDTCAGEHRCLQHRLPDLQNEQPDSTCQTIMLPRTCLDSAAYDVLSSEETRNIYDRYGEEGVRQHAAQGSGGGGSPQDIFSQ